jgi:hypothetical protein
MAQRTLDGDVDCKGTKGSIMVRMSDKFRERHPEICDSLKEVHEKYPCVRIRINQKKIVPKKIDWQHQAKE